jgi:hypothetical protein
MTVRRLDAQTGWDWGVLQEILFGLTLAGSNIQCLPSLGLIFRPRNIIPALPVQFETPVSRPIKPMTSPVKAVRNAR